MKQGVLKILQLRHFVFWIFSLSATEAGNLVETVGPLKHPAETIRLGCFLSWENTNDLIRQGYAEILKPEEESCNQLYLDENTRLTPIILARGDLCIFTTWDKILENLRDLIQVREELCDLPCHFVNNRKRSGDGHCGGNYFFSISCVKPIPYNSLETQVQTHNCTIPKEISSNIEYILPENFINYKDLVNTCVNISRRDINHQIMAYLPRNSPVECTNYCLVLAFSRKMNIDPEDVIVGIFQTTQISDPEFPYNCFCVNPSVATLLISRKVSDVNCFQDVSKCWNCKENSNSETYMSFYQTLRTIVPHGDSELESFEIRITLDTDDVPHGWSIECSYFSTYVTFNTTNDQCAVYIEDDVGTAPANGLWSNCPKAKRCILKYSSTQFFLKSINIGYYMKLGHYFKSPKILVSYHGENTCWQHTQYSCGKNGWGSITPALASNLIKSPEIEIELISDFDEVTGRDFVMIDNITLTLVNYEDNPALPIPDKIVLDTKTGIGNTSWTEVGCSYEDNCSDFQCNSEIPPECSDRKGFWSNCLNPTCILSHIVSGDKIPDAIYLSGFIKTVEYDPLPAQIIISHGSNYTVVTVDDSWFEGWNLSLKHLKAQDVIFVKQILGQKGGFIMVDKIVLTIQPPGDTIPKPNTTTSTTTSPPTTTKTYNCANQDKCNATDHRGLTWSACPGEKQYKSCPDGEVFWTCLESGKFDTDVPNYSNCFSSWYTDIEEIVNNTNVLAPDTAHGFLSEMEQNTNPEEPEYYGHEIQRILILGDQIVQKVQNSALISSVENLTETAVAVFRNILINPTPWNDICESIQFTTGTQLIHSLETTAFELTSRVILQEKENNYKKLFNSFGEISATVTTTEKFSGNIYYPSDSNNADFSIEIPSNWAEYFPNEEIVDFVGISILPTYANHIFLDSVAHKGRSHSIINGNLISFTFGNGTSGKLSDFPKQFKEGRGVRLRFKHDAKAWGTEVKEIRRKLHTSTGEKANVVLGGANPCVYWDDTETLSWSSVGCNLIEQSASYTICECNHLTSFALLMSTHNYIGKDQMLEILTWILCPISIICLAICVGVYSTPSIAAIRGPRSVVTNHLCICLLVGNILMLVFIDKNYIHLSQGFCTTFGIMAHYFFLAAFFWMAFEGYVLYKVLIVVFDDGRDHFAMQYIVAYGSPGIIVLATGITAIGLRDDAYDSDLYCWLNGNYIWGFIGPVAVILLGNTVMLVLSVRKAMSLSKNSTLKTQRHKKAFLTWVKGCASLMCLLGTTWGIGYFMLVDSNTVSNIAAYVFTILNASQGIFLFTFHVCLNKKIRQALRKRLPRVFFSSVKNSATTPTQTSINTTTTLTFGTLWSRRKAMFSKYFETEPKDMKDGIMPESDAPTTRRVKIKMADGKPPS